MYRNASSRELAEFQVFAKAVAAHREDGRVAVRTAAETIVKTLVTTSSGKGTTLARVSGTSERRPGDRPSARPRWNGKGDTS